MYLNFKLTPLCRFILFFLVALMLGSLKLDPHEVKKALLQIDTSHLSEILLLNLINFAPTADEVSSP